MNVKGSFILSCKQIKGNLKLHNQVQNRGKCRKQVEDKSGPRETNG